MHIYQRFKTMCNTVKLQNANAFLHQCVVDDIKKKIKKASAKIVDKEVDKEAVERYKAMLFIVNANNRKYSDLWKKLIQILSLGRKQGVHEYQLISKYIFISRCNGSSMSIGR